MPLLCGIDGCPSGWLCVTLSDETPAVTSHIFPDAGSLFAQAPAPAVFCIDIPIGLTDQGPRVCDTEARSILGPRAASVFPAPIRPALAAATYAEACRIRFDIESKRVSKQSFMIYAKVREVDDALCSNEALRSRVREVHPEVCFWAWNGRSPMAHPKKSFDGQLDRRALIASHFGPDAFARVRTAHRSSHATDDDITDAFAALWTAQRVHSGAATTIPSTVPLDAHGIRMEMCW